MHTQKLLSAKRNPLTTSCVSRTALRLAVSHQVTATVSKISPNAHARYLARKILFRLRYIGLSHVHTYGKGSPVCDQLVTYPYIYLTYSKVKPGYNLLNAIEDLHPSIGKSDSHPQALHPLRSRHRLRLRRPELGKMDLDELLSEFPTGLLLKAFRLLLTPARCKLFH